MTQKPRVWGMAQTTLMARLVEHRLRPANWASAAALLVALALLLISCGRSGGQLKPLRDMAAPGALLIEQPQLVRLSELQADLFVFQDRLLRVTGDYYRLPDLECPVSGGPDLSWALISEGFRLDAVGFDEVLALAPNATTLTVDGVFRRYEGPLGCGKEPPTGIAWYLEVLQIVQPNPLAPQESTLAEQAQPFLPGPVATSTEAVIGSELPTAEVPTGSPSPEPIGTPAGSASPTRSPTADGATRTTTPALTPTRTATPTSSPTSAQTTTTTATPSPTPTSLPGTPTATLPAGPTPIPLPTSLSTATSTPEGYPGPTSIPYP